MDTEEAMDAGIFGLHWQGIGLTLEVGCRFPFSLREPDPRARCLGAFPLPSLGNDSRPLLILVISLNGQGLRGPCGSAPQAETAFAKTACPRSAARGE